MEPRQEDALRRIYQADRVQADSGKEPELFHLRHSGGMRRSIEHPGWDDSWATPSEHTVDDLEELGYLRVEPHYDKQRSFGLTLRGREKGRELLVQGSLVFKTPPSAPSASGFTDEDRRRYAIEAEAEQDLAIELFLGKVGNTSFSAEELAEAVPLRKFDVTGALWWLRDAVSSGRISPAGGGWRVNTDPGDTPTFHVRVVPSRARDQLSGPIYALDLTETEVLKQFVEPYQERAQLSWGDRTLLSYRKPTIGQLYGSGVETIERIRRNLAQSGRVHSPHEAEELFFSKTVRDVTDNYLSQDEPAHIDSQQSEEIGSSVATGKSIFVVHGHSRQHEIARFLERATKQEVVILDEQPGKGRTIIEKFEDFAGSAAFAVVLLTPDDVGAQREEADSLRPRARQNAILELGYFIGRFGRANVAVMYDKGVELPSDYNGVEYIPLTGDWKLKLITELRGAGFEDVDLR